MTNRFSENAGDQPSSADVEAFLFELVGPLARAKVFRLRRAGTEDVEVRERVIDFVINRPLPFAAGGMDAERRRENFAAVAVRAIDAALAEPAPDDLTEHGRRREGWTEGEWVTLVDGQRWCFPDPGVYTPPPRKVDLGDPVAGYKFMLEVATALLRKNYRLTDEECCHLMPFALGDPLNTFAGADPRCLGGLMAMIPEDMPTDQGSILAAGLALADGPIKAATMAVAQAIGPQIIRAARGDE